MTNGALQTGAPPVLTGKSVAASLGARGRVPAEVEGPQWGGVGAAHQPVCQDSDEQQAASSKRHTDWGVLIVTGRRHNVIVRASLSGPTCALRDRNTVTLLGSAAEKVVIILLANGVQMQPRAVTTLAH